MQRVIEVIRATNKPSGVGILLDNSGSTPPLCRFHRFSSAFVKFFFFPIEFQVYVSIRWTTSGRIRKEKEEGNIWEINLRENVCFEDVQDDIFVQSARVKPRSLYHSYR